MHTESYTPQQQRAAHANEAIKVIGGHGCRFFHSATHDRYAQVEADQTGRVLWVDEASGQRIEPSQVARGERWPGFSHGGGLQYLAAQLCSYVATGEPVHSCLLGPERPWNAGNIWGYPAEDMQKVRELAGALPCFASYEDEGEA